SGPLPTTKNSVRSDVPGGREAGPSGPTRMAPGIRPSSYSPRQRASTTQNGGCGRRMRRMSSAACVLKITPSTCGSMASSLEGGTPMLSQACPSRTPAARQPAAAADEAEEAVQDLLRGTAIGTIGAGDDRFETGGQAMDFLSVGDLPDEPGASRAS